MTLNWPFRLPHLLMLGAFVGLAVASAGLRTPATAQNTPDKAAIEAIVKDYLLRNPEIIREAMVELERRQREDESKAVARITSDPASPLYTSVHHTVVGNPNGDVTLVEFFDYKRRMGSHERLRRLGQ